MNINKINGTSAGMIAQQLDAADGKKDGKISASVWNSFVKDKGGKQIKNSISVENAMNSITTYAVRNANQAQEKTNANSVAGNWLSALSKLVNGDTKTTGTQPNTSTQTTTTAQTSSTAPTVEPKTVQEIAKKASEVIAQDTSNQNTVSENQTQTIQNKIGTETYNNLIDNGFSFETDSSGNIVAKDSITGKTYTLDEIATSNDSSIEGEDELNEILGGADKNEMTSEACEEFIATSLEAQGVLVDDSVKGQIKDCMKLLDKDGNGTVTRDELKENLETAMTQLSNAIETSSTQSADSDDMTKETENQYLDFADSDGDGKISEEEYND
jgi:hypothetical protein